MLPVRPQLLPLCRRSRDPSRALARSLPEPAAPVALPSLSPRGLGPGTLRSHPWEKRAIIALVLSLLVFLVFMYIGEKSRVVPPPSTQQAQQAQPQPAPPSNRRPPRRQPARRSPGPSGPGDRGGVPAVPGGLHRSGRPLENFQLKKYLESLPFTPISHFKLGPVGFELDRYHSPENSKSKPRSWCGPAPARSCP